MRTRAERNNFQVGKTNQGAGNGDELPDHLSHILRRSDGIFRDITFQMPHSQIVGAVQHSAVGVTASVNQIVTAFFSGGGVHYGTVKVFCNQRFRGFGTKVAQKNDKCIASGGFGFLHRFQHIRFVFHGGFAFVNVGSVCLTGFHNRGAAAFRQGDNKAVAGYGNDSQLYLRNVRQHNFFSSLLCSMTLTEFSAVPHKSAAMSMFTPSSRTGAP